MGGRDGAVGDDGGWREVGVWVKGLGLGGWGVDAETEEGCLFWFGEGI